MRPTIRRKSRVLPNPNIKWFIILCVLFTLVFVAIIVRVSLLLSSSNISPIPVNETTTILETFELNDVNIVVDESKNEEIHHVIRNINNAVCHDPYSVICSLYDHSYDKDTTNLFEVIEESHNKIITNFITDTQEYHDCLSTNVTTLLIFNLLRSYVITGSITHDQRLQTNDIKHVIKTSPNPMLDLTLGGFNVPWTFNAERAIFTKDEMAVKVTIDFERIYRLQSSVSVGEVDDPISTTNSEKHDYYSSSFQLFNLNGFSTDLLKGMYVRSFDIPNAIKCKKFGKYLLKLAIKMNVNNVTYVFDYDLNTISTTVCKYMDMIQEEDFAAELLYMTIFPNYKSHSIDTIEDICINTLQNHNVYTINQYFGDVLSSKFSNLEDDIAAMIENMIETSKTTIQEELDGFDSVSVSNSLDKFNHITFSFPLENQKCDMLELSKQEKASKLIKTMSFKQKEVNGLFDTIRLYNVGNTLQAFEDAAHSFKDFKQSGQIECSILSKTLISTVNAQYNPSLNHFVLFPGLIWYPLYRGLTDIDQSFIGIIIGHELGHVNDVSGIYFDKDGQYVDNTIWTEADLQKLNLFESCLVNQYGAPCKDLNYGFKTFGEDMADIFGLKSSHRLYRQNTNIDSDESDIKDLEFFVNYARLWCGKLSHVDKCLKVALDVHALPKHRVNNVLRNYEYFGRLMNCTTEDKMNNKQRCQI